jgi:hypothetical protein
MAETEQPKSLDEALAALQYDPPVLVKDKKGQVGSQKTKYADLVQVNISVLARLNGYGVIYVCLPTMLDDGKFVLEYELLHVASGDCRKGRYPLKLSDNPQQMGSAITYARRYALLAVTGIAAEDEDDDGQRNDRPTAQRRQPGQPAAAKATAQRARSAAAAPPLPDETDENMISDGQMRRMQQLFTRQGFTDLQRKRDYASQQIGRTVDSVRELTKAEATKVIDALDVPTEPGFDDEREAP